MLIFNYLDWLPKIPKELLCDPHLSIPEQIGFKDDMYIRMGVSDNLKIWLAEHITKQVNLAGIQQITGDVPVHTDKRNWALNYILDTGGPNVHTNFLCQHGFEPVRGPSARPSGIEGELAVTNSVVIEPNRWHILNTHVYHSVTGVESMRRAITIGINLPNGIDAIKGSRILHNN